MESISSLKIIVEIIFFLVSIKFRLDLQDIILYFFSPSLPHPFYKPRTQIIFVDDRLHRENFQNHEVVICAHNDLKLGDSNPKMIFQNS